MKETKGQYQMMVDRKGSHAVYAGTGTAGRYFDPWRERAMNSIRRSKETICRSMKEKIAQEILADLD